MTQQKEIIWVGELELRFLLDGEDTRDKMLLFEFIFPAGAIVAGPPHYHQHTDEMIYVLEWVLTVMIDKKKIEIGPGQTCFIRCGFIRHIQNNTAEAVKALGLMTPAVIGLSYFKEMSEHFKPGVIPDFAKVRDTMIRNDTIPVLQ